jgi:hypothetical protein
LVRDRGDLAQLPAGFVYRENLPEVNLEDPGQLGLRIDGEVSFWTGRTLSFGDVTGDGIDDLVVGSKAPGAWIVSIVPGGANLRNGTLLFEDYPAIREETETSGYVHAAIAGDVDGDGILDIGIGYSGVGGTIVFGGARLAEYRGGVAEILENGGGVRLPSPFGFFCFVRLRDVTGDGIDDFAVVLADNGEEAGRLHLVAGRRDWEMELDLSSSPQVFSTVMGPGAWFGIQAATVGDADGDGLWDVLVNGSPEVSDASCFLLRVSAALPRRAEIRDLVAGGAATEFVRKGKEYEGLLEVAGPGDVNGDGIADLLIADSRGGGNWSGVSFLIPGGDFPSEIELPSVQEDPEDGILRVTGSGYLAYSGMFIGPAADFNADGFADFLVSEVDKRDPRDSFHYNVIFGSETPSGAINLGRLREHGILMRGAHEQVGAAGTTQGTGDLNGDGIKDFAFAEEGVDWVLAGGHGGPEVIKSDSPGAVYVVFGPSRETPFRRGDCDGDGGVKGQVTDAVFLLNYNFLQGPEPPCLAACDANGDGSVLGQVTDAVFLLTYNFLQGPEPPAPFPDCGAGGTPSDAALGCTTAGACP